MEGLKNLLLLPNPMEEYAYLAAIVQMELTFLNHAHRVHSRTALDYKPWKTVCPAHQVGLQIKCGLTINILCDSLVIN